MIDAYSHLEGLVGQDIRTLTGRSNRVLELRRDDVIVGTTRSPKGQPVSVQWVQDAIDVLVRDGAVTIDVDTVGYRSAFISAVLATLPGATVLPTSPPRILLDGG
jgi:hypothetical protein